MDITAVDKICEQYGNRPDQLIGILHDVQAKFRYLPKHPLERVAERLNISLSQVYSVATFFRAFSMTPKGENLVHVCMGTACHVRGAQRVLEEFERNLDCKSGETTKDNKFTVDVVNCVGACALGPVVVVNDDVHGYVNCGAVTEIIGHHKSGKAASAKSEDELLEGFSFSPKKSGEKAITSILVGMASCGVASGAQSLYDFLNAANKRFSMGIKVLKTGCIGMCYMEPLVELVAKDGTKTLYGKVDLAAMKEILTKHVSGGEQVGKFVIDRGEKAEGAGAFLNKQNRIVLANCGSIDPESIEEYKNAGGYAALRKALLEMPPEAIIDEVKKAGLRGRGGGGFLTARKWETVRKAQPGEPRYVICNADEGDPGAYMDRSVLEGDPHSVIEGMIIGAFAIGSNEGYIYVRNEYPLAVKRLRLAISQARDTGFLGKNILGSGFDFDITINRGGGAFVCGESTALMASLEGKNGEPRAKYIHTAEYGLHDKPSCLNNVETWANVPLIIKKGSDWYGQVGTKGSKGTKIFSLVGKISNTGLVEVPMGITLRKIIFDIGGGVPNGKKFKAVQTGGPSGGCIPENMLDLPVDFDELTKVGSMMGSGGMIVMDEDTCMVDVARYFTHFLTEESCGKCVPCREGVKQMLQILDRICAGEGKQGDVELIEELSETIVDGSLCALGGTAPFPVLSTIKYFRDEYEAHINNKKCPAKVCKPLITFSVIEGKCSGCKACARACPSDAIVTTDKPATVKGKLNDKLKVHSVVKDKCIKCGACRESCKFDAINVE